MAAVAFDDVSKVYPDGTRAVSELDTAFGLPFGIFLLRNFFIGIPKDILESSR